ncbi:hypothetical protein D0T90_03485 [Neisseria animalis]|uniref:Uncharacterized protein n=1 Tax=Neisseria animalis TaxID=492 RepID=A0A5P3MSB2_NEIAN|nr:hypothetical protein D0T90_03485 [Neisseria animalis]ROW32825.1 hypothetical protein CGZ60_03110 [Neisseria animalis]
MPCRTMSTVCGFAALSHSYFIRLYLCRLQNAVFDPITVNAVFCRRHRCFCMWKSGINPRNRRQHGRCRRR